MENHTLRIPEFKFNIGDIVEHSNTHNDGSIFVMVSGIRAEGNWMRQESLDSISSMFAYPLSQTYTTAVQSGSVYDRLDGKIEKIRPGTNISFRKESLEEFDAIEFSGEITVPDNLSNIDQRHEEWKSADSEQT